VWPWPTQAFNLVFPETRNPGPDKSTSLYVAFFCLSLASQRTRCVEYLHEPTRLQVDSFPSLDEKSERVCGDPVEKDSRFCTAHQVEDFRMVKRAAIPAHSGHHPICGRNPLKPASDQEDRNAALAQWRAAVRRLRLLVEQADNCAPAKFIKIVDEFMPEMRSAAIGTVIHSASSDKKEE